MPIDPNTYNSKTLALLYSNINPYNPFILITIITPNNYNNYNPKPYITFNLIDIPTNLYPL